MARREPKRLPLTLLLASLLLHLLVFAASSREALWKKTARPDRPLKFRVVSVEEKPAEKLPPNPDSRLLSNANRRESGAGARAKPPRLRREREERLAARRGASAPRVAAPPPPPESRPPAPAAPPPVASPEPDKTEKPKQGKPPAASRERRTAKPKRKPRPAVKKSRPAPAARRNARKRVVGKKPPRVKRKAPPARKPKERVKVAALRQPSRRPAPRPPAPEDPLAMFRVRPRSRGKPRAPSLDLSDEQLDRIAKKSADGEAEGAGEVVSLDTRDSRYTAYFAHIKRRIYGAWIWPVEAQRYRGRLSLRFALRKDGTLAAVRVTNSSGTKILDDLAQAAVTKAAPFEPLPPGIRRAPLRIEARFLYE